MTKPQRKLALAIKASIWLKDEQRFTLVENLDHTPRVGERLVIDEELWQVVKWTDRIECCERMVN